MDKKHWHLALTAFVAVCLLAGAMPIMLDSAEGQSAIDKIELFMPGEAATSNNGHRVFVTGKYHNLSITLNIASEDVEVLLFNETTSAIAHNDTTYYRWKYLNGQWSDAEWRISENVAKV